MRILIFALLLTSLMALTSCSAQAGPTSPSVKDLILTDANSVTVTNFEAILAAPSYPQTLTSGADPADFKESIAFSSWVFGEEAGQINKAIEVKTPFGAYYLFAADLDFNQLRETFNGESHLSLETDWFDEGLDAWFVIGSDQGTVIVPDRNTIVLGNRTALEAVKMVHNGTYPSSASTDFTNLVHETNFDSLRSEIVSHCGSLNSAPGCTGISWALAGDQTNSLTSFMVSFSSDAAAELAAASIKEEIKRTSLWLGDGMEFVDPAVQGSTVSFKLRLYE